MPKPKAILFDLDGTLRDSRAAIWAAYEHALREHGVEVSRELIQPHIHHHKVVHKALASHVPHEDFEKSYSQKLDELWPQVELYPATPALIKDLHQQGYRLAVVTSAPTTETNLEKADLIKYFEVLVGKGDTANFKPHPEPVQLAITKLGLQPSEVVMVGDMEADVKAAQAAGVPITVAITHGFDSQEVLQAAGASYIIHTLEELPNLLELL